MLKIKHKKELANIIGILLMFSTTIVLALTFIKAYFNDFKATVTINDYNEANIEIVLLTITFILGLYSIVFNLKRMCEQKWKKP